VCVGRKNGQLALRAACRAGERPFDTGVLAVTGAGGPTGPQGPAGDAAQFPVRLVDANQRDVGAIEVLYPAFASVRIQGGPLAEPVLFPVGEAGFEPNIGGAAAGAFYAAADCAGEPYIDGDVSGIARALVYGSAAYYSRAPLIAELQAESYEYHAGDAPCPTGSTATTRRTCCSNGSAKVTSVQLAVRVNLASLGFVPPFRAVAR
jgi:hypothetical protein